MKSQYSKMSDEEIQKEIKMSMLPRKFHGPELKCGGPGMCQDCTERVKLGIPFEFEKLPSSPSLDEARQNLEDLQKKTIVECVCSPRVLFWRGCICSKK